MGETYDELGEGCIPTPGSLSINLTANSLHLSSDLDAEYLDYDEDSVDTDMLPTMLVYHDGALVFNWVRVDWEAGGAGVEELLIQ